MPLEGPDRRRNGDDVNYYRLNDRRIREGKRVSQIETMQFRNIEGKDDATLIARELRRSIAGLSNLNLASRFTGMTHDSAHGVLSNALSHSDADFGRAGREKYEGPVSSADLRFLKMIVDSEKLNQIALRLGGLEAWSNYGYAIPAVPFDKYTVCGRMDLTPDKIDVMQRFQQPAFLSVPVVSLTHLYTEFLPKLMQAFGRDGNIFMEEDVRAYLEEVDTSNGLDQYVRGFWYPDLTDAADYNADGDGPLREQVEAYEACDFLKASRPMDLASYAMLLAREIVNANISGEGEVMLDRYGGGTLIAGADGNLISPDGKVLTGKWEAGDETFGLSLSDVDKSSSKRVIRPMVHCF